MVDCLGAIGCLHLAVSPLLTCSLLDQGQEGDSRESCSSKQPTKLATGSPRGVAESGLRAKIGIWVCCVDIPACKRGLGRGVASLEGGEVSLPGVSSAALSPDEGKGRT
ncbi:hypothetical protein F5Y13DRAFT_149418 [Hypoxylon sp. FL1857]|nr:hypothetical protein F5Y13DRAFT_149418 [Hypoxylon sp. FL1857]